MILDTVGAQVTEGSDGIVLLVPPPRDAEVTRVAIVFFLITFAMEVFGFRAALRGSVVFVAFVFIVTWMIFFMARSLAWNLWRRESVRLDATHLRIEQTLAGWTRLRVFRLSPESRVYAAPSGPRVRYRSARRRPVGMRTSLESGPIVFEERPNKVHRFGEGLSSRDAESVADVMQAKLSSLRS